MGTKQITKNTGAPASGAKNEMNIAMDEVLRLVVEAKAGHLKERADLNKAQGEFKAMFQGINEMLDAVINPLNVAADYVDKISKGNIPAKITDNYNGDFNTIKTNLNTCIDAVNALVTDAGILSKAAVEGKLATRADASKHQGDFQKVVKGVNDCLDSVIGPLNVAAEYVDRISKGDIPPKITDNYNGDFNEIKNNLNRCIEAVNALVTDAGILSKAAVEGKLATRADATKHHGDFQKIVKGVNDCLDSVIGPLNVAAEYVDRISKGDIPPKITDNYNGDFNEIKNNLNRCIDAVNALVVDANILSKAAVEGKLATRADAAKHQGDFEIVQGVDDCLDAVIGPLNVTAKYVDDISKGVIPPIITDNYNGDFNIIKSNLNTVVKMMSDLLKETDGITKAAADGELDKRANADMFLGGWKQLVAGVNSTITNIVDPLMVTADYVDKVSKGVIPPEITTVYKGQYNIIKTNLNAVVKMMSELLKETDVIIKAAADGELDKRANAGLFLGGWNQLVTGVNAAITNIVDPLMVTADYVDKVSKGVIPPEITTVYKGQYNIIKTNLNAVVKMMSELLKETDVIIKAAADGELDKRANAGLFLGGWNQLVSGVNAAITNIVDPLMVTADYVDKVSKGVIPPEITTVYKGQYNIIKTNLNAVVKMMSDLLKETDKIIKAAADGELDKRANADMFLGGWNQLVSGINAAITNIVDPLMVTADYVDKVSKGVIPPQITDVYKGQYNIIKTNLNSVVKMMGDLLKEADVIIKAAADGELDKRANADMFLGGWKQLVTGINSTITNIVNPLMVTADYVEKVSKGVIPPQITDVYKGQYNIIKTNLNGVVKMMSELLTETDKLVKAALNGELGTRANAGLFVGGWNQLVAGVNSTLEAVIIPINEAQAVLEKVAARDMTARVKGDYKGDLGKIKDAINSAVDNLDEALTQVAEATEQVSSGSQQISSGAQSLAQGANDQASSLEEVSSSLEEMASMTKQNADNANQAKTLAGEADNNATVGTEAMGRMSDSINKIKESSDKTAKIVKTIDEIAMQTNLLALNAAVEAARAGEAGRGFAVVAEEVRNLAQRSAEAAKNTADMISESVKNADNGVNIATEVSKSFGLIATSAKKVNDLIAEIAAASQEQSQGIEQVNTAVAQMDKVTQQNAANSEESASAAEEMSSQAEELQSMIAQFALTQSVTQKKPSAAVHHAAATVSHAKAPAPVLKHAAKPVLAKHAVAVGVKDKKNNGHDPIPMDDEALKEF